MFPEGHVAIYDKALFIIIIVLDKSILSYLINSTLGLWPIILKRDFIIRLLTNYYRIDIV